MKEQNYQNQSKVDEQSYQQDENRFNSILEQLKVHCDKPLDSQSDRLLHELLTFFYRRFERENNVLKKYSDEVREVHHQQHLLFLDHVEWSIEIIKKSGKIEEDFCDFLSQWFEIHNKVFDSKLCNTSSST